MQSILQVISNHFGILPGPEESRSPQQRPLENWQTGYWGGGGGGKEIFISADACTMEAPAAAPGVSSPTSPCCNHEKPAPSMSLRKNMCLISPALEGEMAKKGLRYPDIASPPRASREHPEKWCWALPDNRDEQINTHFSKQMHTAGVKERRECILGSYTETGGPDSSAGFHNMDETSSEEFLRGRQLTKLDCGWILTSDFRIQVQLYFWYRVFWNPGHILLLSVF